MAKKNVVWALKGGKLQESKYMGKLIDDKGYFNKVCLCRLVSVPPVSVIRIVFFLVQEKGDTFTKEIYALFLANRGKVESFSSCCFSTAFSSK